MSKIYIDTQIWHWTVFGMRRGPSGGVSYITVEEAQKLLMQAHQRGRNEERARMDAQQPVRRRIPYSTEFTTDPPETTTGDSTP